MKSPDFSRKMGRVLGSKYMEQQGIAVRWQFMEALAKVDTEEELSERWRKLIKAAL